MTERKCANCMWWTPFDVGLIEAHQCRAMPPSIGDLSMATWPLTYPQDWCGAFRMKEPMEVLTFAGPLTAREIKSIRSEPSFTVLKADYPNKPIGSTVRVTGGDGAGTYDVVDAHDAGDRWHCILRMKEPSE